MEKNVKAGSEWYTVWCIFFLATVWDNCFETKRFCNLSSHSILLAFDMCWFRSLSPPPPPIRCGNGSGFGTYYCDSWRSQCCVCDDPRIILLVWHLPGISSGNLRLQAVPLLCLCVLLPLLLLANSFVNEQAFASSSGLCVPVWRNGTWEHIPIKTQRTCQGKNPTISPLSCTFIKLKNMNNNLFLTKAICCKCISWTWSHN